MPRQLLRGGRYHEFLADFWGVPEIGGFPNGWLVYNRKIGKYTMDDDWGYPYFRKPPDDLLDIR